MQDIVLLYLFTFRRGKMRPRPKLQKRR